MSNTINSNSTDSTVKTGFKFDTKYKIATTVSVMALAGVAIVGGVGAANAQNQILRDESVQVALESGDIEAFREAVRETGKARADRFADNIDEEKFAKMQEKYETKQAINAAIENEDFAAFQEATADLDKNDRGGKDGKFSEIDTEEEFQEFLEKIAVKEGF